MKAAQQVFGFSEPGQPGNTCDFYLSDYVWGTNGAILRRAKGLIMDNQAGKITKAIKCFNDSLKLRRKDKGKTHAVPREQKQRCLDNLSLLEPVRGLRGNAPVGTRVLTEIETTDELGEVPIVMVLPAITCVGDSDLAPTNASSTDAIQATTEVSRTVPIDIQVDGMTEWLASLNGSGS